jgi:hypothetical protein
MKGVYLYCIRNHSGKNLNTKGIDGKSKVFGIPYKDIEALVSELDLKEYGSKAVEKRAKTDIKWVIKQAERHEKVVEHAMGNTTENKARNITKNKEGITAVIPMRFGMLFENLYGVEDILKKEYRKFKNMLARLSGKQEWGVTVFLNETALKKKLKSTRKRVQVQVRYMKNLPRGADYFGELEVDKTLDTLMQKEIDNFTKQVTKSFRLLTAQTHQNKILEKESTGRNEPMVFNTSYLIQAGKSRDFKHSVKKLQKQYPEFLFECTGPWPPYSFVQ